MLRELRIRDVAIIDELALTLAPGLNVITGETGAGKSILLQSLAVLCGARGSAELVRAGADEAVIEGLFECALPDELRQALGLEDGGEVLVRRSLSRLGKGRIHINGSPATLPLLAQLGDHLVHIYGQHEQSLLLRPGSHLELLDRFAELGEARRHMAAAYGEVLAARQLVDELSTRHAARQARRELLEFQQRELASAAVRAGEEADLRAERERLRHAERLQALCRDGEAALYSGGAATVAALGRLHGQLRELAPIAAVLAPIAELVESGRVQLEEAALQLRAAAAHFAHDPQRQEEVEERLAVLQRLSRKYGVGADALPDVLATVSADLAALESQAGDAASAAAALAEREAAALALAAELSAARAGAARRLAEQMRGELGALGLGAARFEVAQDGVPDRARLGADGTDRVEFLLAANPGEPPRPLARVASGGELSRIMLALKALTAAVGETPILLFDEVDAGIGGAVADAVGRRLKRLAHNRQLLCITHLPQIAAYADRHVAVVKCQVDGRAITQASPLAAAARIAEVSRMLGGERAPDEAARYAERLLAAAELGGEEEGEEKQKAKGKRQKAKVQSRPD